MWQLQCCIYIHNICTVMYVYVWCTNCIVYCCKCVYIVHLCMSMYGVQIVECVYCTIVPFNQCVRIHNADTSQLLVSHCRLQSHTCDYTIGISHIWSHTCCDPAIVFACMKLYHSNTVNHVIDSRVQCAIGTIYRSHELVYIFIPWSFSKAGCDGTPHQTSKCSLLLQAIVQN